MGIRSKELLQYLLDNHVNFQDREALAKAKTEYRKLYKKNWKKSSKKKHELRPVFSSKQYAELCKRAQLYGLTPTAYIKQLVLSHQEQGELIPNKDQLLEVLQFISMAARSTNEQHIAQAEELLLAYLSNH